jgi:trk system potassium uptake protein TrkA
MNTKERRVCIIGLGRFGSSLARLLAKRCEVLALDRDIDLVNAVADDVQRAVCIDARDFSALSAVVSPDFDEAVVGIGDSLESSILCTLHLRRIGVPMIRAKANTRDHAEILGSLGATHIVFPEYDAAERLALQMFNPNLLDFVPLAKDYLVMDVAAPKSFAGQSLLSLQLRSRFGLFVIAVKKLEGKAFSFLPGPELVVEKDDVLVLIGREEDIKALQESPPSIERNMKERGGRVLP